MVLISSFSPLTIGCTQDLIYVFLFLTSSPHTQSRKNGDIIDPTETSCVNEVRSPFAFALSFGLLLPLHHLVGFMIHEGFHLSTFTNHIHTCKPGAPSSGTHITRTHPQCIHTTHLHYALPGITSLFSTLLCSSTGTFIPHPCQLFHHHKISSTVGTGG